MSFAYSSPTLVSAVSAVVCYLPKMRIKLNLLDYRHCEPNKLELLGGVDFRMIPAACLLI